MEKEPAKLQEVTTKPIEFQVGSYSFKAAMDRDRILIRGYSELAGKMFEGAVEDKDLKEVDRMVFDSCTVVYAMMEDCLAEKRVIELSDAGELKFPYSFVISSKNQAKRVFEVKLKEVEIGEYQRLAMKVDRLEAHNQSLAGQLQKTRTEMARLLKMVFSQTQKIVPQLDMGTNSIAKATVNGLQISTNKGINEWHPYFLANRLQGRMSFQVEIQTVGSGHIVVGISADTLRNGGECYNNADSVAVYLQTSQTDLHSETKKLNMQHFKPQDGWRVRVTIDRREQSVEWEYSFPPPFYQPMFKVPIPVAMREKTLLPVLHLHSTQKNLIKFV